MARTRRHPLRERLRRRIVRGAVGVGRSIRPVRRAIARRLGRPGPACEVNLTWSEEPSTSLTVRWASRTGRNPGQVEIRSVGHGEWRRVNASSRERPGSRGTLHEATIGDLAPGTCYEYRVSCDIGHGDEWSPTFEGRTAPDAPNARFEAVFVCDVGLAGRRDGTADGASDVLGAIRRAPPVVVLGGGDYAFAHGDARFLDPADAIGAWFDQMQPLFASVPFMPQLGNHEVEVGERLADWQPRLPGRRSSSADGLSFSFDLGPAHIVALYAPGRAPRPEDWDWLERDLRAEAARAAAWRIVYQHAPLFAHGSSHPDRPELRELAPRFAALGVDLHLSGHDQNYERTHVLAVDGTEQGPEAPASGPPSRAARYPAGRGVVYAKVSPSGKLSERGMGSSRLPATPTPPVVMQHDRGYHWARLVVDGDDLRVIVESLAEAGDATVIVDELVISRRV